MSKPKFFIVTTVPATLGFFGRQCELLSEHFDVTAISSDSDSLVKFGQEWGVRTRSIPMKREISLLSDIGCLCRFISLFAKEKPDMVHGNTPKGSLLSMLAAWITRVPARIYMCHGLRYQSCTGFKRRLLKFFERITCACATDVICVSRGLAGVVRNDKLTGKDPVVVWNGSVCGIDPRKFNPDKAFDKEALRARFGFTPEDYVLTYVGRIVKDKGIEELVEAFSVLSRRHRDMRLLLVGAIEEGNAISPETRSALAGNTAIAAPGQLSDIPEVLAISDLFVFPSYREGFGMSLMEAGAMEVPSIGTDIEGCNEVIENGRTGLLIKPRSVQEIVDAVERLYNDKPLYDFLKSNCRSSIINRYDQQILLRKYSEYYFSHVQTLL